MKQFFLFVMVIGAMAMTMASCLKEQTQKLPSEVSQFDPLMECMSDSTAYALVNLGNTPVLLVSHETYLGDNEGKDGAQYALAAQLYGKDKEGKIVCFGEIRSQGTLYPLTLSGESLMTAGHHYVYKFKVQGEPKSLYLTEAAEDTGDKDLYRQLLTEYLEGKPIVFFPKN